MGSRRLPRKEAVTRLGAVALLVLAALLAGAAVAALLDRGASPPTAATLAAASTTATPSPLPAATPTPAPEILGPLPASVTEAQRSLEKLLATNGPRCPDDLRTRWDARCAEGDLDGDGRSDVAYFVPVVSAPGPSPARVLVWRAATRMFEIFPADHEADGSLLGRQVFSVADRTGWGNPVLAFAEKECGASNCTTQVVVLEWSAAGWQSIGPDELFENPDRIEWRGTGTVTELFVHAGTLATVGAGPTRAVLRVYAPRGGVLAEKSAAPDPPVYLFHAMIDADARFDSGDFAGAGRAYRAAIADPKLLDWWKESGKGDGRTTLVAYAMFRAAIALAASGAPDVDVTTAVDQVITQGKVQLFAEAAAAFRRGWQEGHNVHQGCIEATQYLKGAQTLVRDMFDYGYGNPRKSYLDICPL